MSKVELKVGDVVEVLKFKEEWEHMKPFWVSDMDKFVGKKT